MNENDVKLIEKYVTQDEILTHLWKEHCALEKHLDKMERKPFLSPKEQVERNRLKKQKLLGRDRIEEILKKYRAAENYRSVAG